MTNMALPLKEHGWSDQELSDLACATNALAMMQSPQRYRTGEIISAIDTYTANSPYFLRAQVTEFRTHAQTYLAMDVPTWEGTRTLAEIRDDATIQRAMQRKTDYYLQHIAPHLRETMAALRTFFQLPEIREQIFRMRMTRDAEEVSP
jgi:hypothetical protein